MLTKTAIAAVVVTSVVAANYVRGEDEKSGGTFIVVQDGVHTIRHIPARPGNASQTQSLFSPELHDTSALFRPRIQQGTVGYVYTATPDFIVCTSSNDALRHRYLSLVAQHAARMSDKELSQGIEQLSAKLELDAKAEQKLTRIIDELKSVLTDYSDTQAAKKAKTAIELLQKPMPLRQVRHSASSVQLIPAVEEPEEQEDVLNIVPNPNPN